MTKEDRSYDDYLHDIADNAEMAILFAANLSIEEFLADVKSQYAIARACNQLGNNQDLTPRHVL